MTIRLIRQQIHEDFYPENLALYRLRVFGKVSRGKSTSFMQIGHVNVDIHIYVRMHVRIRHFERSSWQSYQFTTASIFWKISKHSNIQRLCKGANALWASLQKSHRHVSQTSLDSVIRRRGQTWSLGVPLQSDHISGIYIVGCSSHENHYTKYAPEISIA